MEEVLDRIIDDFVKNEGNLVSVLQNIQDELNYISEESVYYVSEKLNIPAGKFFGVATFYSQFYLKPRGKNIMTLCSGTACHVKGSEKLIDRTRQELQLAADEETTKDGNFTLEKVACVGACSIAPVAIINKKVHGKVNVNQLLKKIKELNS
ncbi:NADH-quinone oxidoreductase subunit NuoE family protein [Candidatus Magnetomonas plexicatena]|uniref:NADH-quinone oxidoreductase subunit NuoE family protein n=1 Tax=Candidatus Magnetomonas plexicatena TaxID=2552947 RepID=UPI001C766CB1|nr:NAD(P)H-dependent oxidoreductase subunit E [Nitrospirales bacterium LBB_01]